MAKSTSVTARLTPELSDKLTALARETKRSKSRIASEAIASYVEANEAQVARIMRALAEDEAGEPGVAQDAVLAWVDSWGTDRELPRPRPKKA
jgi:predicted transcriptional regulator